MKPIQAYKAATGRDLRLRARKSRTFFGASALGSGAIVISIVLIVAAVLKLDDAVDRVKLPPSPEWLSVGAIVIEFLTGVWLLSGAKPMWASRVALVVLSVFLLVAGKHLISGDKDCGCFGRLMVPPLATFSFDAVAVCLLGASLAVPSCTARRWLRARAFAASLAVVFVPAALLAVHRQEPTVTQWVGKPFPILTYLDRSVATELSRGPRTVLLVDSSCDRCMQVLRLWLGQVRTDRSVTPTVIDVEEADPDSSDASFAPMVSWVHLGSGRARVPSLPILAVLDDGVVSHIAGGEDLAAEFRERAR